MREGRIGVRCKDTHASEVGRGNVAGLPFNRRAPLARLFESQKWLGLLLPMLGPQLGIIGANLLHKGELKLRVDQAPDDADGARGIEDVNDRLREAGGNL